MTIIHRPETKSKVDAFTMKEQSDLPRAVSL